jgi:DNA-binding MarR family transcriptional regulator
MLNTTQQTALAAIRRLVDLGLVLRIKHFSDHRKFHIGPTPKGQALLATLKGE